MSPDVCGKYHAAIEGFSKELGIADLHVSFADVSIAGKAHLAGLISVDRFLVDSACDQWKAVRDDAA